MSKSTTKALKKELELQQQQAETEKALIEAEVARLNRDVMKLEYDNSHAQSSDVTGVFRFNMQVTDASCANLAARVRRYAARNPGKDITIVIHTPGGSVPAGFALFDELRTISEQGHHITTQVRGYAASMGAVLLQAGDTRLVGPESLVMLHEISSMAIGKLHEMENDIETAKKLNTRVFEIIARRTGGKYTGPKLYAKVKAKDWWIGAEEAVANGIADAIG